MPVTTCDKCVKFWITEQFGRRCPECGGPARAAGREEWSGYLHSHLAGRRQDGAQGGETTNGKKGTSKRAAAAEANRRPSPR